METSDLLKIKFSVTSLYGALLKNEADVELFQKIAFMTRERISVFEIFSNTQNFGYSSNNKVFGYAKRFR